MFLNKDSTKKIILNRDDQGKVNLIVSSETFITNLLNFNSICNDSKIVFWINDYRNLYDLYGSIYNNLLGAVEPETIGALSQQYLAVNELVLKKILELHSYLLENLKITHQARHNEKIQKNIGREREKIKTKTYSAYNYFIKTLLVLNAGAVVALLAYISKEGPHLEIAQKSIIYFGLGIISSVLILLFLTIALIVINSTQNKYLNNYKSGKINFHDYYIKSNKTFSRFRWIIPLAIFPLILFIIGFVFSIRLL